MVEEIGGSAGQWQARWEMEGLGMIGSPLVSPAINGLDRVVWLSHVWPFVVNLANLVRLRTIEFCETDNLVSDKQCDCLA